MKVLNLKILSPSDETIQNINFKESGISFIYGDITEPENRGATINSLGKSLLIKMLDYIYGANEDSAVMKENIIGYTLLAKVKVDNLIYNVKRVIGSSLTYVNDNPYELNEYKKLFCIERRLYDTQLLKKKKNHEISQSVSTPSKNEYISLLQMLNMNDIIESLEKIYVSQDNIRQFKANEKDLVKLYGDIELKKIDEEIYFIDEEIKKLSQKLNVVSERIKNIEISSVQRDVVEEFSTKSNRLKHLTSKLEKQKIEKKRLEEFIENSGKADISAKHIEAIFKKVKQELPELVKRNLHDVEEFHKTVYEDRKDFLNQKILWLERDILRIQKFLDSLSLEIDNLGKIISLNKVYQESISLYEKFSSDLQQLKFKEGKLSQIKNIHTLIKDEDSNLIENFQIAKDKLDNYSELLQEYRDFIKELTHNIYSEEISSYFKIEVIDKHLKNRPIRVELNMRGDTGEGVSEVKKNIIDYLLFNYNKYVDILVQDSACFNGIDPRQVCNMIHQVSNIANTVGKQAILAINKYQLGDYSDTINFVSANASIVLSENTKLMGFDF